jgi:hypothetical protein
MESPLRQMHRNQRTLAILSAAMFVASASLAQQETCADQPAQLATVSALGKRHSEMAQTQQREWDRYVNELREKGSARGWSDAKKREMTQAPLHSPEYIADESLKRPHQTTIESWMKQLKVAEETNDLRSACMSVKAVQEASDRLLEIQLRQYKLALRILAEE